MYFCRRRAATQANQTTQIASQQATSTSYSNNSDSFSASHSDLSDSCTTSNSDSFSDSCTTSSSDDSDISSDRSETHKLGHSYNRDLRSVRSRSLRHRRVPRTLLRRERRQCRSQSARVRSAQAQRRQALASPNPLRNVANAAVQQTAGSEVRRQNL